MEELNETGFFCPNHGSKTKHYRFGKRTEVLKILSVRHP
jgi:hypothetical protein